MRDRTQRQARAMKKRQEIAQEIFNLMTMSDEDCDVEPDGFLAARKYVQELYKTRPQEKQLIEQAVRMAVKVFSDVSLKYLLGDA